MHAPVRRHEGYCCSERCLYHFKVSVRVVAVTAVTLAILGGVCAYETDGVHFTGLSIDTNHCEVAFTINAIIVLLIGFGCFVIWKENEIEREQRGRLARNYVELANGQEGG